MQNINIHPLELCTSRPVESVIQVWHPNAKIAAWFNGDLLPLPSFNESDTVVAIWRRKPSTIDATGKLNLISI